MSKDDLVTSIDQLPESDPSSAGDPILEASVDLSVPESEEEPLSFGRHSKELEEEGREEESEEESEEEEEGEEEAEEGEEEEEDEESEESQEGEEGEGEEGEGSEEEEGGEGEGEEGGEEAEEGEEGGEEEGDESADDFLGPDDYDLEIPVKVDGEESTIPLGKLIERAQKSMSAESRFREAAEIRRQAEGIYQQADAFYRNLQSVEDSGVGGMPLPFQAMIEVLAGRFDGDSKKAYQYFNGTLLPRYIQSQSRYSDAPDRAYMEWERHALNQSKAEIDAARQQTEQEQAQEQYRRTLADAEPIFAEVLSEFGFEMGTPDADRVGKAIIAKIAEGEEITKDVARTEAKRVASEVERLVAARLSKLSPEEVEKLNPAISKKIRRNLVEKKSRRPTKRRRAKGKKKASSTRPSRRTPESDTYVSSIEELAQLNM